MRARAVIKPRGYLRPGSLVDVVREGVRVTSGNMRGLWGSIQYPPACSAAGKGTEKCLTDEPSPLDEDLTSHRGLQMPGQGKGTALTCPHVLQVYHEARGKVEGIVESVAEEGGHVEGGQQCRGSQSHGPAAEDHQPHQHEVQEEELRDRPQVGQPVDGHPIHDDVGTVLRQLTQDLQSTALARIWSQHQHFYYLKMF